MTGQIFSMTLNQSAGRLLCLLAAVVMLAGCATETKTVYDQAPSAAELSFDAEAILRVADRLRETGDYMSALRMYQQVREREPKNTAALIGEGEILLTLGAFPEAEQRFRAARGVGDESMRSAAGLGRSLLRQNRPEEALAFFEKALEEPDTSGRTYNGYGVTLDLLGRHGDAQIAYSEGLDQSPGNAILTNNLALSFALSEDYPAALRILSDLAGARPDAEGARENLALVYGLSGDMDAARNVAALDHQGDDLEKRLGYITRIAALPGDVRGEAIILGIVPDVAVAANESSADGPEPAEGSMAAAAEPAPPSEMEEAAPAAGPETVPDMEPMMAAEPPYMVQLGAYGGEAKARAGWKTLVARAPDLLKAEEPAFQTARVGEADVVRLGIKVSNGYSSADALCASLKAAKVDCLVRRMEPQSGEGGSSIP